MLEIKNTEVFNLERAMIASGNAMTTGPIDTRTEAVGLLSPHYTRGMKLGKATQGTAHDHYLSGVLVCMDMKYPLYLSPELQRYHWFEIISSQSTMHRLSLAVGSGDCFNKYVDPRAIAIAEEKREQWEADKSYTNMMELRSNLPWGFEMWMTVNVNYLQLKTMYNQRKAHRLKEDWGAFLDWCDGLPMFNDLTGCGRK